MKRAHSFLTLKAEIKKSLICDKGVFAKEPIKKGELISIWGGVYHNLKRI